MVYCLFCFQVQWRPLLVAAAMTHLPVEGQEVKMCPSMLQELRLQRMQHSGTVNVEVDSTESVDLAKVMEEMREQYEALVRKRKMELEEWFKSKVRWGSNVHGNVKKRLRIKSDEKF